MPKQIFKIKGYHGGINDVDNPKDITEFELQEAQDVRLDKFGKIIPWGRGMLHDAGGQAGISVKNQGLFSFSSDRIYSGATEVGENWLVIGADGYLGEVSTTSGLAMYYESGGTWDITTVAYAASAGFEPVFYYVDGALRFCDSRITETTNQKSAQWYGYIKRTHFDGLDPGGASANSYDDWYIKNQTVAKPTSGIFGEGGVVSSVASGGDIDTLINAASPWTATYNTELDLGTYVVANATAPQEVVTVNSVTVTDDLETVALSAGTWAGDTYYVAPAAGTGFNLELSANAGGSWPAGDYTFASTFIYDNKQESLLYQMIGDSLTVAANDYISAIITCTAPFDPRITGARIYARIDDSDDSWVLIYDISLRDGCRTKLESEYEAWVEPFADSTVVISGTSTIKSYDQNLETYELLNGFSPSETDIALGTAGMGYKFAIVAGNRKAYIANVRLTDPDGEVSTRADLMIASLPNRFDTFLWSNRIEVAIDDGDEITGLVYFADRILQFKRNRLYIINVSQNIEFLESTHEHAGARGQHAICKFEDGVLWVNDNGIYIYDGERVIDVTINQKTKSRRLNWGSDYYSDIDNVAIGYHPASKIAVIALDTSAVYPSDALLFHIPTGAFTLGSEKLRNPMAWCGRFETDTDGWVKVDMDAMVRNTSSPISGDGDLKFTSTANGEYIKFPLPFPVTEDFRYQVYSTYRVDAGVAFDLYIGDTTGTDWSGGDVTPLTATTNTSANRTFNIQIPAASAGDNGDAFLIIKSVSAGGSGYIDDIRIEAKFSNSVAVPVISNFINDWDGKLIYTLSSSSAVTSYAEQMIVCYYDPDEYQNSTPKIVTKDFEFEAPDNKKNIYNLIISHKGCGASNVQIYYRSDGAGSWTSAGTLADSDTLVRESFAVAVKNIYSLEVKVEAAGVINSGWQIDSMSIVERVKNAGR